MRKALRWLAISVAMACGLAAVALMVLRGQAAARETRTAAEAAPAGGRFVQADDVEVFVQEQGPADAPAVMFIHGTGAWSETWRPVLNAVAGAGFRAIAIDLPPFGYLYCVINV